MRRQMPVDGRPWSPGDAAMAAASGTTATSSALSAALAVLAVLTVLVVGSASSTKTASHAVHPQGQHAVVQHWARKLGEELADFANSVTRIQKVHESFKKTQVEPRNGTRVLSEVAGRVQDLLARRADQVQRIREAAERLILQKEEEFKVAVPYVGVKDFEADWITTPPPPPGEVAEVRQQRQPAKRWLRHVDSFPADSNVNISISAVHVPATVYDGSLIGVNGYEARQQDLNSTGAEVQRVIELTEELDEVFTRNMKRDRTTSWQFIAHHTGVMRQYPASKWNMQYHEDNYDARMRPWYIGAATSPKDVVILVDNSGSFRMTEPSLIASLVVRQLLETLSPDDFVNVLLFQEEVHALVPGMDDRLIPATSANIRELQRAMHKVVPVGVANVSLALTTAFVLLERYRRMSLGAGCNQAVMLVTDVVPEYEEGVFALHNWPAQNKTHARVFTFLVGKVESEERQAKWMACANMGWHLNIQKNEEQDMIKYVPVMARPIVLSGLHPVHWSHVYPDLTVPGMTDVLWRDLENDEQLRRITPFCFKHAERHPTNKTHSLGRLPVADRELGQSEDFTITVSVPVRNISASGRKDGALMGVAGIDVPVSQILKLLPHYKIGVNAYFFMVTNNGLVVFHPDLRPRFNGIIKPGFNSIDMTELEQEDSDLPRNASESMLKFRDLVVNQTTGTVVMTIRKTFENWHRVARLTRRYFFQGLADTPYSLVLATPAEDYGVQRVQVTDSSSPSALADKLWSVLNKSKWRVHPNWTYCGVPGPQGLQMLRTPAAECDRELLAALLHDGEVTQWFGDPGKDAVKSWSRWDSWRVSVAFLATHSGLTRWLSRRRNTVVPWDIQPNFESRGPDELWYRRAVDAAGSAPESSHHWVLSVPLVDEPGADVYSEYNAAYDPDDPWAARRAGLADSWVGSREYNLTQEEQANEVGAREVTMTAAVFRKKAAVAVAGLRFPQAKLQALFEGITTTLTCPGTVQGAPPCGDTCASEDLDCYLLDEHGVVQADEKGVEAGRSLALVNRDLMARLEAARVYQRVTVYDYQGVCRRLPKSTSTASALTSKGACWAALAALWWGWGEGRVQAAGHSLAAVWALSAANGVLAVKMKDASTTPEYKQMLQNALAPHRVRRTTLQLCDMKLDLHQTGPWLHKPHTKPLSCEGRSFAVAAVPGTNLVLVTALNKCKPLDQFNPFNVTPSEVRYFSADGINVGAFRKADQLLPRRRPATCFREHELEKDIAHCGRAAGALPLAPLIWSAGVFALWRPLHNQS